MELPPQVGAMPHIIPSGRIDWVDYAKGFCIIFVVMLHSVIGVEKVAGSEGWMHAVVQFAKPFRMPDFFIISGLFLGLVIDRPWIRYLDRKVVHFLYFYVLWFAIQFAFKAPGWLAEGTPALALPFVFLIGFIEPFGTLWFIYILPLFFVVTRLLKPVPWPIVLAVAALLEILPIHTGWTMIDETASRFVYFYAGYIFASRIFALADSVIDKPAIALLFLAAWFGVNLFATFTPAPAQLAAWAGPIGHPPFMSDLPVASLVLGAAGAVAVICATALVSRFPAAAFLRYLGRHSIVVYLAFFLPMAISRTLLLNYASFLGVGLISLLVTIAAVAGPILIHYLTVRTGYGRFLFERPVWAHVDRPARQRGELSARLNPAE
jgi:uncharacterized membrane protein YcfT